MESGALRMEVRESRKGVPPTLRTDSRNIKLEARVQSVKYVEGGCLYNL